VKVKESYGPDRAEHYNSYLTAAINGAPGKGFSSGQAEEAMARVASDTLPKGMSFEWTDLTFQKVIAGNTAIYIFPLCVLLVFLVLAAPNDFDRVYRRCLATRSIAWRRSRDAARDGYRSVFRDDRGHAPRIISDSYLLCDRDKAWTEKKASQLVCTELTMRVPLREAFGVALGSPRAITSDLRELALN
jgi:hypothetical protein